MADEEGFFDDWPKWSKPLFALSAMILLGGVWIGIPLLSALKVIELNLQSEGQVDYQPMMAVLIAMTTATITGIFVFMTFRIDRGTRLKAERVAKEKVDELVKAKLDEFAEDSEEQLGKFATDSERKLVIFDDTLKNKCREFDKDVKRKFVELKNKLDEIGPEVIKKAVQHRIPEDVFRAHIEAVLLANANGQIVKEYAKERAAAMDAKSVEALLCLLRETIEHVAQYAKQKPEEDRGGPWTRARAATAGWWHRLR